LPPGPLATVLPVRVWRVESMRPNVTESVQVNGDAAGNGHARHWRDLIELADAQHATIHARFADGHPAYVQSGKMHYFTSIFDESLTRTLFARIASEAGLSPTPLGNDVRVSRRGGIAYVFNYSNATHTIDGVTDDRFVIGTREVAPQGVAAYRMA
jgi:beta-galactosidase